MSEMNLEGARLILEGWAGNPNEKAAVRRVFDELKRREWEAEAWRMSYMAMREARDLAREERDQMRRHGIERSDDAPAHSDCEALNDDEPAGGLNNENPIGLDRSNPSFGPNCQRTLKDADLLRSALKAIAGTSDIGPWRIFYREAGGDFAGLQAIADAALNEVAHG